jgi:hypothetical protein
LPALYNDRLVVPMLERWASQARTPGTTAWPAAARWSSPAAAASRATSESSTR